MSWKTSNLLQNHGFRFLIIRTQWISFTPFGSIYSCQGLMTLIGDNHLPVERVLEVVVPDIVPGQPHSLTLRGMEGALSTQMTALKCWSACSSLLKFQWPRSPLQLSLFLRTLYPAGWTPYLLLTRWLRLYNLFCQGTLKVCKKLQNPNFFKSTNDT